MKNPDAPVVVGVISLKWILLLVGPEIVLKVENLLLDLICFEQ